MRARSRPSRWRAVLGSVLWVALLASRAHANISVTPMDAAFYANQVPVSCRFLATTATVPAFRQQFTSLNFNPPLGLIPGTVIDPTTTVFTNVQTKFDGSFLKSVPATGNGFQAGVDPLGLFSAAITGQISVDGSQQVSFDIYHDDGFILGFGAGARRIRPVVNPPTGNTSIKGLPITWQSLGIASKPVKTTVVVQFEDAGDYDFELDYVKCKAGQQTLTMFADDEPIQSSLLAPTATAVPTRTATKSPTVTPTITPGGPTLTPTVPVSPSPTTPSGTPPTATATPTRSATRSPTGSPTPTPTMTPPLQVSLIVGDAQGRAGDTVTVSIEFDPSRNDGNPLGGSDQIATVGFVLDFPDLNFDPTDSNGDGVPDAITFNPEGNPDLNPFAVTLFNDDSATSRTLVLEVDPTRLGNDSLPAGILMNIAFTIPYPGPGGDFPIAPSDVVAVDIQGVQQQVTQIVTGVVHALPPFTRTPAPVPTDMITIHTKGGDGCAATGTSGWSAVVVLLAVVIVRGASLSRRRRS